MASAKAVIKQQLELGGQLLIQFSKDLTGDEFFHVPSHNGNHAAWLLGHIACTEDWGVATITGCEMRFDQMMRDRFDGGTTCYADPGKYPSRSAIEELFTNARSATLEALDGFDEGRWGEPSPKDAPVDFFPTLGALWTMMGTHQFWHLGQLTTCRASLGKPRLLT